MTVNKPSRKVLLQRSLFRGANFSLYPRKKQDTIWLYVTVDDDFNTIIIITVRKLILDSVQLLSPFFLGY
jgi:hypothetical protein